MIAFQSRLLASAPVRLSLGPVGAEAAGAAQNARFSPDGTRMVFESLAALAPADQNGSWDLYERELATGRVTLISANRWGEGGSGGSLNARYGAGGRIVFDSAAYNLAGYDEDANGARDVFVRAGDGTIARVSVSAAGVAGNADSVAPILSPDGRLVLFESLATNLVPGDTNGARDLFVKDLVTGELTRVSVGAAGQQAAGQSGGGSFSPDGTKILFESNASNLVPGDTNAAYDVFLKDLASGTVTRVSTGASGEQGNGHSLRASFTPDGRGVVFESTASNLVPGDRNATRDVFLKDLATGAVTRLSVGAGGEELNGASQNAMVAGGRVIFESTATNAVPGDANARRDVFVRDLASGVVVRVSVGPGGVEGNGDSLNGRLSPDGTAVVFDSFSSNLVPGDTNGQRDVFMVQLQAEAADTSGRYTDHGPATMGRIGFTSLDGSPVARVWADAPAGAVGSLIATVVSAPAGAGAGEVAWSFLPGPGVTRLAEGETRTERYQLTIEDRSGARATTPISVTVVGANDAPTARDDRVLLAGPGRSMDLAPLALANDRDPDDGDAIHVVAAGGARYGTVELNAQTGALHYTPAGLAAQLTPGSMWSDRISYTIADRSGATASAWIDVTLVAAPGGPSEPPPINQRAEVPTNTRLIGGAGSDVLIGGPGHDMIDGGAGEDRMAGGPGNDIYVVDRLGDSVVELDGEGWDTIRTALTSYRLPANVEELAYSGTNPSVGFEGAGNELGNRLTGGPGPDRLYGFGGNDYLIGGGGSDQLDGGPGDDWLDGGPGADRLRGGPGADTFVLRKGEGDGDTIEDFRRAEGDRILLTGWGADTRVAYDAASRTLTITDPADGARERVTLLGDAPDGVILLGTLDSVSAVANMAPLGGGPAQTHAIFGDALSAPIW
ncbi:MAG: Ig-like domain-containing protein [Sphingomonadaceae bacterium]|nr:Ig-like domain-containing protein [Sphingomonadaceae bacterium]